MSGISDKAIKNQYVENKYRYNAGSELANKEFSDGSGLEMYETAFRGYDPQLGRFWQIDPLALINEDWSPYAFASDNPTLINDPFGLADDSASSATIVPAKPPHMCLRCNLPAPDVAKAAGRAPNKSNVHAGGGNSGNEDSKKDNQSLFSKIWDKAGEVAYHINDFNPLAQVYNWISTAATGKDSYGVKQDLWTASTRLATSLPVGRIGTAGVIIEEGASSFFSYITPKIVSQMARRGWTKELIHEIVNSPFAVRTAVNRATGNAATAFFSKEGFYVVKDNITNEIIQISNRLDPGWIPDATIVNPFKP